MKPGLPRGLAYGMPIAVLMWAALFLLAGCSGMGSQPVETSADRLMVAALEYREVKRVAVRWTNDTHNEDLALDLAIAHLTASTDYGAMRQANGRPFELVDVDAIGVEIASLPDPAHPELAKAFVLIDQSYQLARAALEAGNLDDFALNEATLLKALLVLRKYKDAEDG